MNTRRIVKEPVGVVGAIVPWNYPFEVSITKLAQALATGNTVVLKPAPDTPWNATFVGRIAAEHTDIPPGVLNVITSSDHGRRATDPLPRGRPHLLHRLDGGR
jgi:aldehyde dehydrogenase (NAD+)